MTIEISEQTAEMANDVLTATVAMFSGVLGALQYAQGATANAAVLLIITVLAVASLFTTEQPPDENHHNDSRSLWEFGEDRKDDES